MRFIHLSDLHIGKRVNEYSMIEDQKHALWQILGIIDAKKADAVIIAGDIYDKSVPSAEAVELFDNFLTELAKTERPVFIISGNHDSPERLAFGSRLMAGSKIYISPVYNGKVEPIILNDEYGEVCVYLLPFVKPANVKRFFEDSEINSYTDALKLAIDAMNIDTKKRNILVTHQLVTGASRTDSEEISVGGTDNIDPFVFDSFDYAALGHIHRAQRCGADHIRYSGTPLKYSFSEAKDKKTLTVVDIKAKGEIEYLLEPINALRDLKEIKGRYAELMAKSFYEGTSYTSDYMHITLTDEDDVPDAIGKLRVVYKNLMKLSYDNTRTQTSNKINADFEAESKTPIELFSELYMAQNGSELSDNQKKLLSELIEEIWEGDR